MLSTLLGKIGLQDIVDNGSREAKILKKNTKMNQKQYNKTVVLDEFTSRQGTGEDYRR